MYVKSIWIGRCSQNDFIKLRSELEKFKHFPKFRDVHIKGAEMTFGAAVHFNSLRLRRKLSVAECAGKVCKALKLTRYGSIEAIDTLVAPYILFNKSFNDAIASAERKLETKLSSILSFDSNRNGICCERPSTELCMHNHIWTKWIFALIWSNR